MIIKVTIADDHPMVISGIQNMLQPFAHIQVISTFSHGMELLEGIKINQPDVVLLDILMPHMEGPEIAQSISRDFPDIKILAITSLNAPSHIKSMMRNGCKGYLLKNTDQKILVEALETVFKGEEYIEPVLKEQMLKNMLHFKERQGSQSADKLPLLTRREKEILQLIIQEYSSQEIAEQLFLSLRTVENHRFNIQQKLNVKNIVGMVKMAIQMGLV